MANHEIVLHPFRSSHFNEKARWALAWKGLEHERVTYLPGPHRGPISKLTGGATTTPVMAFNGRVTAGSAAIIDALEAAFPDPPLYPADTTARRQALDLQTRFDAEVGPATRTVAFTVFVKELSYLTRVFAGDGPRLKRLAYRLALPVVRPIMAKANGVTDPANVAGAFDITRRTFDQIAEMTTESRFLVGDIFSVADLTAAALLAPLVSLSHPDMRRPDDVPPAFQRLVAEWKDHPATAWVQAMYRDFRPA